MSLSAAAGWISSRFSPPTPKAISGSENRKSLDATRKKIDDATRPERERVMQQYQRRGLPPAAAPKATGVASHTVPPASLAATQQKAPAGNNITTPSSQQPRRSQRHDSSAKSTLLALEFDRPSRGNSTTAKSTTSSLSSTSPDLLQQTAETLDFSDDRDGDDISKQPPPLPRLPRMSNITEEGTLSSAASSSPNNDTSGSGNQFNCCAFELCCCTFSVTSGSVIVSCMECQRQCHLECAEDFYLQTPRKDGRLPFTAFSKAARKRCKAAAVVNANDARFGSTIAAVGTNNSASSTSFFCFTCRDIIQKRREDGKKTKKTTLTVASAPKKKVLAATIPESVRMELRRAVSFYCRSLVFSGQTTSADKCHTLMAKTFYGDMAKQKMAAVDMLLEGVEPFKELYDEYEGDNGRERVLKPWLSGSSTPVQYVPGIHFTAETISEVGKGGGRKVSGNTLWKESLATVKAGKKAISFIPDLDICDCDPSTFAVTGVKSGHNLQEVFEEINKRTKLWSNGEKKRLDNMKKVERDEWDINDDDDDDNGSCDNESTSNRFPGFFAFVLFGPTRQGSAYSSLWRRSEDESSTKRAGSRASMKAAEHGGKQAAKQKRQAEATEQERKKMKVEDTKYREFRMKFEVATVAQTKDELEAQRFDSEMARLSKLIDTETSTSELKLRLQDRCKDGERAARYEREIDQHMENIEKYTQQLVSLEQKSQQSNNHVDALLGTKTALVNLLGNVDSENESVDDTD